MTQRSPRTRDDRHLAFIRQLPCLVCLDNTSTEACHVRFTDRRAAKFNPGMGQKPSDWWTVPMCGKHHREQHAGNEQDFWFNVHGIDPIAVAAWLYLVSGDYEAGEMIVREQH